MFVGCSVMIAFKKLVKEYLKSLNPTNPRRIYQNWSKSNNLAYL